MPFDGVVVVPIVLGREGIWGLKNGNLVPLGAARQLRNATLEDGTYRTAGGAAKLGDAISGTPTLRAAIDYWPTLTTQRTLVAAGDGALYKDNGSGASWVTLASGLTASGAVPHWAIAGAEAIGRDRKAFHCDRINAVRVLAADAATASVIATPALDWVGATQPGFLVSHQFWLWGGGNSNAPKRLYRSSPNDHEDFQNLAYSLFIAGEYERLSAGLSYKGGLLVWGYPEGVWFLSTEPFDDNQWRPIRVGVPGAAGPACVAAVEDDVLWVAPDGSWHLISATQATGSVRAGDISARKLGDFMRTEINLAELASAQLVYFAQKQRAMLACHGQGATAKNRRIDFDVLRKEETGERWLFHDRDRNEALYLRKGSDEQRQPAMGDAAGQLWRLEQTTRTKDGDAYSFEWAIWDADFSELVPGWAGRLKNLRFLELEYDPKNVANHAVGVLRDGELKQTVTFELSPASTTSLPVTLPFTFPGETRTLKATAKRQLYGQARRLGFQGSSTGTGEDASVAKLYVGVELAGR